MILLLKASEEKEDFFEFIEREVTFNSDIISVTGYIMYKKGEKAYISDVIYNSGYYSHARPDIYIKPKISSFQINHITGHWRPDTFVEFQNATN